MSDRGPYPWEKDAPWTACCSSPGGSAHAGDSKPRLQRASTASGESPRRPPRSPCACGGPSSVAPRSSTRSSGLACVTLDPITIEGIPVKPIVGFRSNESDVALTFDVAHFLTVERFFVERYGPPTRQGQEPMPSPTGRASRTNSDTGSVRGYPSLSRSMAHAHRGARSVPVHRLVAGEAAAAALGIPHYWLVDPVARRMECTGWSRTPIAS